MKESKLTAKIAQVSVGALKSFLGVGVPETVTTISAGSYSRQGSLPNSGWLFDTPSSGLDTFFSYGGLTDILNAYTKCPPVYSIINKQAYAFTNGKTWILDRRGKESKSAKAMKVKALLAKPNPLQNEKQFKAQFAIYVRLFGYCIIMHNAPVGYGLEEATALWIIPPFMCDIEFNKKMFFNSTDSYIQSIKITYGTETTTLTGDLLKNVIFLKDITIGMDALFMPGSPIRPIQANINNLIGIYNSKGALINSRGALGILTPEMDPNGALANPTDKEEIQNDLMKYGIRSYQWKFIVANSAMKWQQMGMAYKDLMLTEWAEDDTMAVCDALNYPYKLLSNTASGSMGGTEANEWKKLLYQDFTIPFGEMLGEQIGSAFKLEDEGLRLEYDFSHVQVLQEDDLKKAQARKARNDALNIEFMNNMLTLNRWRELNGEDPMEGEEGNLLYNELIAAGWVFGKGGVQLTLSNDEPKAEPEKEKKK